MKVCLGATIVWTAPLLFGGAADFGRAEFARAVAERKLDTKRFRVLSAVVAGAPESYSIQPGAVTGGDERGLMYGLLEAAGQVREHGRLLRSSGRPAVEIRGIRWFLHNRDLEKHWFYSREHWKTLFQMLARNRFNRFNLVFAHQTNYLSPPYPFWLHVPEFPAIKARNLTDAERQRNLEMLRYITTTAQDHGVDFVLGVWQHNVQSTAPNIQEPVVDGLNRNNIGPYSYAALRRTLELCPGIRTVQLRTNAESGIPGDDQLDFYGDHVFRAIRDAGRTLDLRGWSVTRGLTEAAASLGLPLRLSTKYWAEYLGRPYQPAETFSRFSYGRYLQKPHRNAFFWELWGLGSHRLLLWGNPDYVRRVASTLSLGDGVGFEIDPPLAQKGFGNQPGEWSLFRKDRADLVHWQWEWERYWLFYLLWGRLSYDPGASASIWESELQRRFGKASSAVLQAYRSTSAVLHEIVAAHLADPNMYIWPELNPGGLIDSYLETKPSDWRYVASITEAVENALAQTASAKQTPTTTAERLDQIAARAAAAIRAADQHSPSTAEWRSTRTDFMVLEALARFHAHRQREAHALVWFDRTADSEALDAAEAAASRAVKTWEQLAEFTGSAYSPALVFGPQDIGHWKDKLPYVRHDLQAIRERREALECFGSFERGFDLGGPLSSDVIPGGSGRNTWFVRANTVAPRFQHVDPDTLYNDARGYGWTTPAVRRAKQVAHASYRVVRAVERDPRILPMNTLFGDSVCGAGEQVFQARLPAGRYKALLADAHRKLTQQILRTDGDPVRVSMPPGEWCISALVFQRLGGPRGPVVKRPAGAAREWPRPVVRHQPPATARAGDTLRIPLSVRGAGVSLIRLHYRAVNQLAPFKTVEFAPATGVAEIPAADITPEWDLMYYFEILNEGNSGWFEPDPAQRTPYYVVKVQAKEAIQ